ncbi:patatin-like phospholipase family protein [Herbaspirillum aquaticum]|nr:patatin-like phospholipase family protein [Herbaspirillum aquaticum]
MFTCLLFNDGFVFSSESTAPMTSRLTPVGTPRRPNKRIALVLQGGGALGAYQAGVYQALDEHGLCPDWVVGTSIGAINGALIAGNAPSQRLERLKQFWLHVSQAEGVNMQSMSDAARQLHVRMSTIGVIAQGVPGFFSPRLLSLFGAGMPVVPEQASLYETSALAATLKRLVDFNHLNRTDAMRLTVNALRITNGELASFDNTSQTLTADHILASGALPPAFPPVRIDGQLYWDGGLYSNTPLETILNDQPPVDTLCFMVDLWRAQGPEPSTLDEVYTRQKDIMFSSRSTRHIAEYRRAHDLQCMLQRVYEMLPQSSQRDLSSAVLPLLVPETTMHIVRLIYPGNDWQMAAKDINFSRGSIDWRWSQGYSDATQAVQQAKWMAEVKGHQSVIVHELDRTNE